MTPAGAPRGIDQVREALRSSPEEPIDLLVGDPCFSPPDVFLRALAKRGAEPSFAYSDNQGTLALRRAIASLHERSGEAISPDRIFVTQGAKLAALALFGSMLEPGDRLLVPQPCYPPYLSIPARLGIEVVPIERRSPDFRYSPELFTKRKGTDAKALVITSPCNPTGATLSEEEARELVRFAREEGIHLILDEAYEAFRYGEERALSIHALDPEGATVSRIRSFSKTYGVCGWRTGYVIAEPERIQRLARFQAANLNPPNTLMQRILEAAPQVPESFHERAREAVRKRIRLLVRSLSSRGIEAREPSGGFYLFADLRKGMSTVGTTTSTDFCCKLAREEGIAFWPGSDFGGEGWARIAAVALRGNDPEATAIELAHRLGTFLARA